MDKPQVGDQASHAAQAVDCLRRSHPRRPIRLKRKWTRLLRSAAGTRAALRATLVANAYLEAEIERLTEAISTGFARGRLCKPSTKSHSACC